MNNLLLKQDLTSQELQMLTSEMDQKQKSPVVAWLLWFFLGVLGAHRFYTGKLVTGILMLVTLGGFFIWALIDIFFVNALVRKKNEEFELSVINQIVAMRKSASSEVAATVQN